MDIGLAQSLWFFPLTLPICAWVVWSDLSSMRIPNIAVLALIVIFVLVGFFLMPLPDYGMRFVAFIVAIFFGMLAVATGQFGAGDAKFIAASILYITPSDRLSVLTLFALIAVACIVTHRAATKTVLKTYAPNWKSWDNKTKKFPMGFPLAITLSTYLAMGIFQNI